MPKTKTVNSIKRGVKVLELIAEGANRLEDIYPRLEFSKSTTHRLLKSLVSTGLAVQSPINRHYYLGYMFVKLGSKPLVTHNILILCALAELKRLRDLSRESALIIIPNGLHRLVVKEIPSREKIAFFTNDGNIEPIYAGSAGKLLLSQFEKKECETILKQIDFHSITPKTITNIDVMKIEIDKIRKQGHAISFGELQSGAAGISVPVKNYICPVALSLFGPAFRFSPENYLTEMKESAHRISVNLDQFKK